MTSAAARRVDHARPELRPAAWPIVQGVFLGSGFAALLYQMIWQRLLTLFGGADVYSVTLIVSAFMGGPGYEAFDDVVWVDENVVDGAVNGIGKVSTLSGRALRVLQSGYVRNYALGIGIGAVLLLGWFVSRGVF